MQTKYIIGLVVVLGIIVCCVFFCRPKQAEPKISAPIPVDEQTALATLRADMKNATPHFIDSEKLKTHEGFTPEEQKIKDDVIPLYYSRYVASNPDLDAGSLLLEVQNGTFLDAIGERYLLVTEATMQGATDVILDSQTGQVTPIPQSKTSSYYLAPDRNIALYIDFKSIYTYSLDQTSATLVVGSELSGSETYHDGVIDGIYINITPHETHTKNSITIAVFDESTQVPEPVRGQGIMMNKKVREITLSF